MWLNSAAEKAKGASRVSEEQDGWRDGFHQLHSHEICLCFFLPSSVLAFSIYPNEFPPNPYII